jgi:hypothetical protein
MTVAASGALPGIFESSPCVNHAHRQAENFRNPGTSIHKVIQEGSHEITGSRRTVRLRFHGMSEVRQQVDQFIHERHR